MPRVPISNFKAGIDNQPAFSKGQGAADMLNVVVDEIGRLALRDGYVLEEGAVSGDGNNVLKVHFVGDENRPSFSRIYRLDNRETYVFSNGRLFVAGVREPRWIDVERNISYTWGLDPPKGSVTSAGPVAAYDANVQRERTLVTRQFGICYTWGSRRFGIESEPSKTLLFPFEYESDRGHESVTVPVTINLGAAPLWADTMSIYMTMETQGGSPVASRNVRTIPSAQERAVTRVRVRGEADFLPPDEEGGDDDLEDLRDAERIEQTIDLDLEEDLVEFVSTAPVSTQALVDAGYSFAKVHGYNITGGAQFPATYQVNLGPMAITYIKENERLYPQLRDFSDAYFRLQTVRAEKPPERFTQIKGHAGRIWGYDPDSNTIRYSLIDGTGTSAFDVFPFADTDLPHAINTAESYQSQVIHIEPIPPTGGLYIFFSNALRSVTGQALLKGMFSPETPPQTDLDASGGIEGVGTLSPRSVVAFRNAVIFFGTDKTLYQLTGGAAMSLADMGLQIQSALDAVTDAQLADVHAFGFNDRYYLSLPGQGIYCLDIKRKYWTRLDIEIKSAFWSRGGSQNESILYAVRSDDRLIRLFEGTTDAGEAIEWAWESNEIAAEPFTNFSELFCLHSTPSPPADEIVVESEDENLVGVTITVDGREVVDGEFDPSPFNNYRFGFYARGSLFKAKLSGQGTIPRFSQIDLSFS